MNITVKAQTKTVTGSIKDEQGLAMHGVSIKIKGSVNGTLSDGKGNYTIKLPSNGVTLVYSFQGYQSQEVSTAGKTIINLSMTPSIQDLSEIVVIGYGEVARKDLTGAIATVKTSQQDAIQFNTVDELLKGRAAGVQVTTSSSAPGGIASVRIRGTNSLRSDNEPLYVIDGVIMSSVTDDNLSMSPGANNGQEAQNGLSGLNTQDIESIEVLKDASATAIYGSRGANGVIIITTKKGRAGNAQFILSTNTQLSMPGRFYEVLDGPGYARYINDVLLARGNTAPRYDPDTVTSVNWQKQLIKTGITQNHRISVSGGSKDKNTIYYLSAGYINTQGVLENTGAKVGDIRLNLTQKLTSKLDLTFNLSSGYQVNNMTSGTEPLGSSQSSMIQQLVYAQPFFKPKTDDGNNDEALWANPTSWINDYADISKELRFQGNLSLSYKISPTFTYRLNMAGSNRNKDRARWYGPSTYLGGLSNGQLGIGNMNRTFYSGESLLMFRKGNKKHQFNGTVGLTYNHDHLMNTAYLNKRFFSYELTTDGFGYGSDLSLTIPDESVIEIFSALARLNYTYNNKYLFTLTGRADGSSKFSGSNKFAYFPSASFAWRAKQEHFLKNVEQISDLKLRIGFGITGNQGIRPYSTIVKYGATQYPNPNGGGFLIGVRPQNVGNTDLKWESTSQVNAGLDIGVFGNNLTFTVDAYYKKTTDLLQNFTLPYSAAYATIAQNYGSLENRGLEFSANANIIDKGDFKFGANANLSFNRNKILDLGLTPTTLGTLTNVSYYYGAAVSNSPFFKMPANVFIEGRPLGLFYGLQSKGIWQNTDDIASQKYYGTAIVPGNIRYVDQNGDNNITDDDRVILGNPNPDFIYGFGFNFSYKKISLNAFFNGSYGNEIVNGNMLRLTNTNGLGNILASSYYNAWTATNPSNEYPRLNYEETRFSDRLVEDGSYLRLSTVNLNYDLPLKSKFLKQITFSVTGKNLWLLTRYSGYDPEVNSFGWDASRIGVDWASYPNSKAVTFGINAKF
ncbi:TonB-dependent receptor [Niabella aquatica]